MRVFATSITVLAVTFLAIACTPLAAAEREVRAVWTHAGTGAFPGDWDRSAKVLADNGFNMVLPNMLWGGAAHYASDVLPRSEVFRKHGDQLEQCCAAAKKHGIEVHVWKVNYYLGRYAPRDYVEKLRRAGRLQVDVEGKPLKWLCPSNPENQKLELESMLEVARKYPVAGLHFDYIRYKSGKYCYCDGCRIRFEADSGRKVSHWPEDCYSGARKDEYNDWRCRQITALVERVSREAKKIRPEIKISAAVFGAYPACRKRVAQDWPEWIKAGYLDFVCPMDYTNSAEKFAELVRNQAKLVGGRIPLYPGIGAAASHSKLSVEGVLEQIRLARSLGAEGFVIFNYNSTTAESIIPGVGEKLDPPSDAPVAQHGYDRSDYGRSIASTGEAVDIWWCEAGWKVAPKRTSPQSGSPAATLSAARNDREAVQIVVRPKKDLRELTAEAGPLVGPDGAVIPADRVKLFRVYYHHVHTPTDSTGVRGDWPDALPPLEEPLNVSAGRNQPLWVLVHVPNDARPGDYSGKLMLKAEGWSAEVPLRLHVWDFALPERNHLETAIGLHPKYILQYHRLNSEADRRKVWEMYLQNFAEHRVSPYDPVPFDPIRVKFLPEADPPCAKVDFAAFDAAMARVIEKHNFTNFRMRLEGMGWGSAHGHGKPSIAGFAADTPQYQAMFSSYVKQIEEHLREKGRLNMPYVYWFDEPRPQDYAFVRAGMERLKKYAPGLTTMLTEQPEDELAGPVDIWCPVTYKYDHTAAEARRTEGDRFWWYVCCGPKAPYCTLFIDHPATELRVWLWQSWQRDVEGVLVWSSNYWTSRAELMQNPYEDPMGYRGGSRPEDGRYWGNGDGRFLYPPLSVFDPDTGEEPVLEPPVSSIRWEMLREGIEDYEFLCLLRKLIDERRETLTVERLEWYESLLEVPDSITSDMTAFTTDPRPIHARRAAVAEAVEEMSGDPAGH